MNIREFRERSGLSQIELAAKMETTAGTISRWESGLRNPDPESIVKLAKCLKCTTDDLLNPPPPSATTSEAPGAEGKTVEAVA